MSVSEFIIEFAFKIITTILAFFSAFVMWLALRYKRKEHRLIVEGIFEEDRSTALFLNRESMLNYLLSMYDRAVREDVIWGQCVNCGSYSNKVHSKVIEAASKGVGFKIIVNASAPAAPELRTLYESFRNAEVIEGQNNTLRIQGLSEQEVVLAFPRVSAYTAVLIKDPFCIKIFKEWFDNRFEELKSRSENEKHT